MTKDEEMRIIFIHGKNYRKLDIPAYIRQRDDEEDEDEKFDYHPRPEEVGRV